MSETLCAVTAAKGVGDNPSPAPSVDGLYKPCLCFGNLQRSAFASGGPK
jgi:hypothetical protein